MKIIIKKIKIFNFNDNHYQKNLLIKINYKKDKLKLLRSKKIDNNKYNLLQ